MKKLLIIFFMLLFISNSLFANTKEKYLYGFVYNYDILANYKDARDSLKKWIEKLAQKKDVDLEVIFYDDVNDAYRDFKDNKLHLVVVGHDFFFDHKDEIEKIGDNYWSLDFTGNQIDRFCVIKRNNVKFNSYADLKGKRVSVKQTNGISYFWLDKNSLEVNHKPFEKVVSNVIFEQKESTLVLNVFFNKSDLTVVREDTWSTMLELNPSLKKYVSLYECSDTRFSAFVGIFSKETPIEHVNVFFDLTDKLRTFSETSQLFALLNFKKVYRLDNKQIDIMNEFYGKYKSLKEKYSK